MFTARNLQINRGVGNANAQGKFTIVCHSYQDITLTVAAIKVLIPPYFGEGATQEDILVDDHLLLLGSDTTHFCRILTLNPVTLGPDLFGGALGLTVSTPLAAVDLNGIKITAGVLQQEIADATHPGIMTIAAQSFTGIKTFITSVSTDNVNERTAAAGVTLQGVATIKTALATITPETRFDNGIKFSLDAVDADQTLLDTYNEEVFTSTFTINLNTTTAVTFKVIKVGKQVTVTQTSILASVAGQVAPGPGAIANTALPAKFRPTATVYGYWPSMNDNVPNAGLITISHTTGIMAIFANSDASTPYETVVANGFFPSSFTYNIA